MFERPVSFDFDNLNGLCSGRAPLQRKMSNLSGIFHDCEAYGRLLAEDPLVYEFYDFGVPERAGNLAFGTSICYPGKVGEEYYMTKGHYHVIVDTAEVYYCIHGQGLLLMETPAGDWVAEEMVPGRVVYVPGGWAHRSINTGAQERLITLFSFRADAGHDYATIETRGFRKLAVEKDGQAALIDNPKWSG